MSAPRRLLRGLELIEDDWRYAGEAAPSAPMPDALIVPLAELARVLAEAPRPTRLGVRLAASDAVETLEPYLGQLELVAIDFPGPGEGRGYSAARLLRERFGFRHEIRAVGKVKPDQLFFMARSGFDAFELSAGESLEDARRAWQRFDVAYQPGASLAGIHAQRFTAQRSGSATSANS
jgi:uncharacterized protein (DUF934 family)